jgi:hypothetical protein
MLYFHKLRISAFPKMPAYLGTKGYPATETQGVTMHLLSVRT